jgi:hypothetical protein
MKRTAQKLPQKQPLGTAPLPASATEDSLSRHTRSNRNSSTARTVERAIHNNSFHSNPGRDEIKYSDNDSDYTNNIDDAKEDNGDGKDDDESDNKEYEDTDNEEENFDNTDRHIPNTMQPLITLIEQCLTHISCI